MKKWIGIVLALGIVVALLCHAFRDKTPHFPPITDPDQLHRDAVVIMDGPSGPKVSKGMWPNSVRALNPYAVFKDHRNYVGLTLPGGDTLNAYLILKSPGAREQVPPYMRIYPTQHTNIFKCFWGDRSMIEDELEAEASTRAGADIDEYIIDVGGRAVVEGIEAEGKTLLQGHWRRLILTNADMFVEIDGKLVGVTKTGAFWRVKE